MIIKLQLYSTSHCHLCEQAESLLLNLKDKYDIKWEFVEIIDDISLLALYETKIPVLKRPDTNNEICWPFNEADIKLLLS